MAKIPRYATARTSISQLESGVSALPSPAEAASAAGAGFKAITSIAGIAGEAVEKFAAAKDARELEEAKLTFALGEANRDAALALLDKDPELEDKQAADPEYYSSAVKAIEEQYATSLDSIKDRKTRERMLKVQEISLVTFRSKTESGLGILQTRVGKNRAITAGSAAELANNPDMAESIYAETNQYFSPAEEANQAIRIKNMRTKIQSDAIADDVLAAYQQGGEEAAMDILQAVQMDDSLSSDVQKLSLAKGNLKLSNALKVDKTERVLYEQQLSEESSKRRIVFEQDIGVTTSNEAINTFADAEDLTHAERRQLFTIREKKANAATSFKIANPNSKQYRDSLDEVTQGLRGQNENGETVPLTLEQQYAVQIGMLGLKGENQTFAIGSNLTSTMVKAAASDDPEVMGKGLEYYANIMEKNPKTKLDFGDTDTTNFYESAYQSATRAGGDENDFVTAAKEQQAIHVSKAKGLDSIKIADAKYAAMKDELLEDVGDILETMGIDIPGTINDSEFQYDGQFQVAYLENARDITRYMEATEGTVDPAAVKRRALKRTLGHINANFMNAGVPIESRQFFTNKGLQDTRRLEPQLSVNVLDGAEDEKGGKALRKLAEQDYVVGGVGLNGKKVKYNGRLYTLTSEKFDLPVAHDKFGMPLYDLDEEEADTIRISSIEFFTGGKENKDKYGATTADLRYMGLPIYDVTGKAFETWNRFTTDDYIMPEGMTDISGGVEREDINPRIKQQNQ